MQNEVQNLLQQKGIEKGLEHVQLEARRKKRIRNLILSIAIPILGFGTYKAIPHRLSTEEIQREMGSLEEMAKEDRLSKFCSNWEFYQKTKTEGLENLMNGQIPKELSDVMTHSPDVRVYHMIGLVKDGKVSDYTKKSNRYSKDTRILTRNPDELRKDLSNYREGKGLIIAAVGLGRGQFNLLPDGSMDPNCLVAILNGFRKENPKSNVKAIYFHGNIDSYPLGQGDYERFVDETSEDLHGYSGAAILGKDDLARPRVMGEWKDSDMWPQGPGNQNMSPTDLRKEKTMMDSYFKGLFGSQWKKHVMPMYYSPWGLLPNDPNALKEIGKLYKNLMIGSDRKSIIYQKGVFFGEVVKSK